MCAKAAQSNMIGRVGDGAREGQFSDFYVVFPSVTDPECFEAHSIKTDQIGIGDTAEEALYELFASLADLLHEYRNPANKGNVCLWQIAEESIVKKLFSEGSIPVPNDLVERALQRIRGSGPPAWKPDTSDAADLE